MTTVCPGGSPEENELPQVSRTSTGDKTKGVLSAFLTSPISEPAPNLEEKLKMSSQFTASTDVEPESPGAMAALNLSIIGDTKLLRAYQQVKIEIS